MGGERGRDTREKKEAKRGSATATAGQPLRLASSELAVWADAWIPTCLDLDMGTTKCEVRPTRNNGGGALPD
jgi:hypothetical protein